MASTSLGNPPPESFHDTQIYLVSARNGEDAAYQKMLARFRPGLETLLAVEIHKTVGTALKNKLAAAADDVMQETIVKGFKALDQIDYRGPGSVLAYFAQILRNEVHNFRAYWTADRRNPGREAPPTPTEVPDSDPVEQRGGPGTMVGISEDRQRVADALAKLEDLHREMLVMRFFGGASWTEVATELQLTSPDAARMECKNRALPAFALALSR